MPFSPGFFEVSAQLLPLLFLAMVVEDRLQPEQDTPLARVGRSWILALFVVGEVIAVSVVAGQLPPSDSNGSLVAFTMLASTFLIALPVFERELRHDRSRIERLGHASAGISVILVVLASVLEIWVR